MSDDRRFWLIAPIMLAPMVTGSFLGIWGMIHDSDLVFCIGIILVFLGILVSRSLEVKK